MTRLANAQPGTAAKRGLRGEPRSRRRDGSRQPSRCFRLIASQRGARLAALAILFAGNLGTTGLAEARRKRAAPARETPARKAAPKVAPNKDADKSANRAAAKDAKENAPAHEPADEQATEQPTEHDESAAPLRRAGEGAAPPDLTLKASPATPAPVVRSGAAPASAAETARGRLRGWFRRHWVTAAAGAAVVAAAVGAYLAFRPHDPSVPNTELGNYRF